MDSSKGEMAQLKTEKSCKQGRSASAKPRGSAEEGEKAFGLKMKKRKVILSYEVFWDFIEFDEEKGIVDVSGVFSQECFLQWLSTRPNDKIKFPAQSYQRVLYAHIRGADKRRHFPEPVENELLRLLRDVKHNPWKQFFKDKKVILGKRGFKSKGFHEKSRKVKEEERELLGEEDSEECRLSLRLPSNDDLSVAFDHSEETLNPKDDPFDFGNHVRYNLHASPANKTFPWDSLKHVINTFVSPEQRQATLVSAKERGITMGSPAIYFYLNQMVAPNDFRFSDSFLFPPPDEQIFRKNEPVATLIVASNNIIVHEDKDAVQIFRGSILDRHVYELYSSLLSLYYSYIRHIPSMYGKGVGWRREIFQRNDATRMVCLVEAVNLETIHVLRMQDHSDLYPKVLNKPCFI